MDASLVIQLKALVANVAAPRVLALGTGDGEIIAQMAAVLPPDGTLFAFEPDPQRAAAARARLAQAGVTSNVHVMIGAPARLLHKVAGPFDVVVACGAALDLDPLQGRIRELLRPGGTLMTD